MTENEKMDDATEAPGPESGESVKEPSEEQAAADELSGRVWASLKAYLERTRSSTAVGAQHFTKHR